MRHRVGVFRPSWNCALNLCSAEEEPESRVVVCLRREPLRVEERELEGEVIEECRRWTLPLLSRHLLRRARPPQLTPILLLLLVLLDNPRHVPRPWGERRGWRAFDIEQRGGTRVNVVV